MTSESFFKDISFHYNQNLPLVVYKKGGDSQIKALLQKDATLHLVKNFKEKGFIMAPFDSDKDIVILPLSNSIKIELETFEKYKNTGSDLDYNSEKTDHKKKHLDLVNRGIDAIKSGQLEKVVLSRKETLKRNGVNPFEIFKNLISNYPNAFVYWWYHPFYGLWLGATPETLIQVDGFTLKTMSLAGTKTYNGSLNINWSQKELQEQKIVTDYIVERLSEYVNDLRISDVQSVKAGRLSHLQTTITGFLKPEDDILGKVVLALHPTPAVCGRPLEIAKQFILNNEDYNRDFYTGFLGELNFEKAQSRNRNRRNIENNAYASIKKTTSLYVNLRCMQLKRNEIDIYVGGGITEDSNAESEWQETVEKTSTIKKVL